MIVVDANVITYLVIQGEHTRAAELVSEKDNDWHAPLLWRSELLNVLSRYMRKGILSVDGAMAVFEAAHSAIKNDVQTDESVVLGLIRDSQCSSYDCEYVAAAKDLQVPLVTADKQLLRSFPSVAISMSEFVAT